MPVRCRGFVNYASIDNQAYFTRPESQNEVWMLGVALSFGDVSVGGWFILREWVSQRGTRLCMFDDAAEPQRRYSAEFTDTVPDNHVYYDLHTWTEHLRYCF